MPDLKTALLNAIHNKPAQLHAIVNDWDKQEQEIRQSQPQQEKAMQATQTTTTPTFQTTGTLSRDTFAYIKQHSGKLTPMQVARDLQDSYDFNPGSVQALITQLRGLGMVERQSDGTLVCCVDEYRPVSDEYKKLIKARQKLEKKEQRARKVELLVKAREMKAQYAAKRKASAPQKPEPQKVTAPKAQQKPQTKSPTTQGIAALQAAPTPAPIMPTTITAESVLNGMGVMEARKLYDELKKIFG